jgi:hypothetical protein
VSNEKHKMAWAQCDVGVATQESSMPTNPDSNVLECFAQLSSLFHTPHSTHFSFKTPLVHLHVTLTHVTFHPSHLNY